MHYTSMGFFKISHQFVVGDYIADPKDLTFYAKIIRLAFVNYKPEYELEFYDMNRNKEYGNGILIEGETKNWSLFDVMTMSLIQMSFTVNKQGPTSVTPPNGTTATPRFKVGDIIREFGSTVELTISTITTELNGHLPIFKYTVKSSLMNFTAEEDYFKTYDLVRPGTYTPIPNQPALVELNKGDQIHHPQSNLIGSVTNINPNAKDYNDSKYEILWTDGSTGFYSQYYADNFLKVQPNIPTGPTGHGGNIHILNKAMANSGSGGAGPGIISTSGAGGFGWAPPISISPEELDIKMSALPGPTVIKCDHTYKTYTGLFESYEYCSKCDNKKVQ